MNLYPFVTAYPKELHRGNTDINLEWHHKIKPLVKDVVFCWGAFKEAKVCADIFKKMYPEAKVLKLTKDGSPWHPLYLSKKLTPIQF